MPDDTQTNLPKTQQLNWLTTLLAEVKSENKYRNGFIIYWIIWNYDFVLLLLGKISILDDINFYYQRNGSYLWKVTGEKFSHCSWILYFFTHRIAIPLALAFFMPNIWDILNSGYSWIESKFGKYKKNHILIENEKLKKEIQTLERNIKNYAKIFPLCANELMNKSDDEIETIIYSSQELTNIIYESIKREEDQRFIQISLYQYKEQELHTFLDAIILCLLMKTYYDNLIAKRGLISKIKKTQEYKEYIELQTNQP